MKAGNVGSTMRANACCSQAETGSKYSMALLNETSQQHHERGEQEHRWHQENEI